MLRRPLYHVSPSGSRVGSAVEQQQGWGDVGISLWEKKWPSKGSVDLYRPSMLSQGGRNEAPKRAETRGRDLTGNPDRGSQ